MRGWKIHIPIRPKCVQSTSFRGKVCYTPKAVREWKAAVRPFIAKACTSGPTKLPVEIIRIRYSFHVPKAVDKKMREYLKAGGVVPCMQRKDITDNLNKGLVDVCKGLVFEDDSQVWRMSEVSKVWALEDCIDIEIQECPDVVLLDSEIPEGFQKGESDELF